MPAAHSSLSKDRAFHTPRGIKFIPRLGNVHYWMTACPEVFLAREAEMCYSTMAHVTDYDVWRTSTEPVSVEMVIQTLNKNTDAAKQALENLVEILPESSDLRLRRSTKRYHYYQSRPDSK
jgi:purine nucleoside phosphorylase